MRLKALIIKSSHDLNQHHLLTNKTTLRSFHLQNARMSRSFGILLDSLNPAY